MAREQRIKVGEIERNVIAKRVQAINAAQAELQRVSNDGNETFALFCAARGLPAATDFVKIEGEEIVVKVPDETDSPA